MKVEIATANDAFGEVVLLLRARNRNEGISLTAVRYADWVV
jgi:hypothetical protein